MKVVTTSSRNRQNRDLVQYARGFGLAGLEVVTARWVDHAFAPHMHDFYAVSLNDGGRGAFDCRNGRRDAAPGTCNLIAPGESHTGQPTVREGWAYRNLHIDPALMATLLQGLEWHGPVDIVFKSPLVRDAVLATRLRRAFESLAESNTLLQNESLLLSVVARLVEDHVAPGDPASRAGRESVAVGRVQEWLDAHAEQNVSLGVLARLAGLSPYHLVRVFHRHLGVPPHRYQTIARTLRARRLLMSGHAISDVAQESGFCDQSHLNRCFKQILGVTPGRYAHPPGPSPRGQTAWSSAANRRPTSRTTSIRSSTSVRRSR